MEYRKIGQTIYARIDKGDEIIENILAVCKKENIDSAVFSGIGGCSEAEIQTFIPSLGAFETEKISGMLELVSMNGNVLKDENGDYCHHTHAMFSFKENGEHKQAGGHMKSATVLYTAEIEIRPTVGGIIKKKFDPETGTGFWSFE
ncbi:MAG: DUF296 domain-containing protein [Clostridia bacterium]|nr:DUF296 domain-containing protein [Clostridia bacterium]